MADRRGKEHEEGTGGRGGLGTLPDVSVDDFVMVTEPQELSRTRTAPSKLQPLVDMARANLGRKIERTDVVMENGEPKRDEAGNIVRQPHVYTKTEAEEYVTELGNLRQRNKLPQKRLSLRILTDPQLDKAKDTDTIRVQFYIVGRKPETPTDASA